MIKNHDRSGWFGASDTAMIMGNWNTKSFCKWWFEKLGVKQNKFTSESMMAGTAYEHLILDYLGIRKRDRQIKKRSYRLRVNLDGEDKTTIYEVKTHIKEVFKVTNPYWQQAQVESFATRKKVVIVSYHLSLDHYNNYFLPIEKERLFFHPIEYDQDWVELKYLKRLEYLAYCLRKNKIPTLEVIK